MDAQLKISEVAEKINSIETGGGSTKKATVKFSAGEGNEASFNIRDNFLTTYWSTITGKAVIQIDVENAAGSYSLSGSDLERRILTHGFDYTIDGNISGTTHSGTITITAENGLGKPSNGSVNPFIVLVLVIPDNDDGYEYHVLEAYYSS